MNAGAQLDAAANVAAEEVLRVIYGDDLEGCAVSLDSIAAAIRAPLEEHTRHSSEIADLHAKAFEAVQLLATPPATGKTLLPEELRSLLSERLDQIRELAAKVLSTTQAVATSADNEEEQP